ncbi:hypothetical protein EYZ11_003442 [Aspergillus tanneri]|uniref:Uncharacterized protein n=1 Tax=Aspergillus tanneri TaxID=1220188 RepID=A0A4V3UQ55_9EURO|nr:hypothetical protein EYZ11_003442 [Aspergillus tanneri]
MIGCTTAVELFFGSITLKAYALTLGQEDEGQKRECVCEGRSGQRGRLFWSLLVFYDSTIRRLKRYARMEDVKKYTLINQEGEER